MATKEETLVSVLATATGVSIYSLEKKSTDNHCIIYREISSKKYRTMNGKGNLSRERYLISCYGESYGQVKTLSDLVFNALECNTTNFHLVTCENESDEPKEIETNLYCKNFEFFVW